MKIGDKLYCKKEVKYQGDLIFEIGNKYIIKRVNGISISVGFYFEYNDTFNSFSFHTENNTEKNHLGNEYLWDFFYTDKQLRKTKLKKLYESG